MNELKLGRFYFVANRLAASIAWLNAKREEKDHAFYADRELDGPDRIFISARLRPLPELLEALGARISAMTVQEGLLRINADDATWSTTERALTEVSNNLNRELTLSKVFAIDVERVSYFEPPTPLFGLEVATKFPSASYEIEEAAKCLALDRSTASAFHSIRCLEAGIRALSRCLRIPDPVRGVDRSWGNVLRALSAEIDRRWPKNSTQRQTPDAKLFERAHAALAAMMNPWRNDTMHLDEKYTDPEAVHIFEIVKGFMMIVASRCDEDGEPKA